MKQSGIVFSCYKSKGITKDTKYSDRKKPVHKHRLHHNSKICLVAIYFNASINFSANSTPMRSCASLVAAPMCGVKEILE